MGPKSDLTGADHFQKVVNKLHVGISAGLCVKNRIANPSRQNSIGLLMVLKSFDPKSAPKISPAEFYQDCGRIVEF